MQINMYINGPRVIKLLEEQLARRGVLKSDSFSITNSFGLWFLKLADNETQEWIWYQEFISHSMEDYSPMLLILEAEETARLLVTPEFETWLDAVRNLQSSFRQHLIDELRLNNPNQSIAVLREFIEERHASPLGFPYTKEEFLRIFTTVPVAN